MSLYMLHHGLTDDVIKCTYKKKSIPVGFYDSKLAERISKRIAKEPRHVNCRLKPGKMLPIAQESYIFDEDTNHKLQGLRRDLEARLILHRDFLPEDTDKENDIAWHIRRVPEDIFYAYPFTTDSGIVICYDIDALESPLLPTHAFDKKNIFLKSVVMSFDTPSVGQLNRLYHK